MGQVDHRFDADQAVILHALRRQHDLTADIEGRDVVADRAAVAEDQAPGGGFDPDDRSLQKRAAAVFDHLRHVEARLGPAVEATEHPGSHPRIVVIRIGADQGDTMPPPGDTVQVPHDGHVRVAAADQYEVMTHAIEDTRV